MTDRVQEMEPATETQPQTPINPNTDHLLDMEATEQLAKLYDLYGLGDIGEISFNLLDSSPEGSFLTRTSNSAQKASAESSYSKPASEPAANSRPTASWINSVFAYPSSQLPDQLMYAPMQYIGDHLAFPDYMMVHSHSGLPVLINDPVPSVTANMAPYGGCVYQSNSRLYSSYQLNDAQRSSSPDFSSQPQFVQGELASTDVVKTKKHTAKVYLAPRKRGRPKKTDKPSQEFAAPGKLVDYRHRPVLDEKENLPCKGAGNEFGAVLASMDLGYGEEEDAEDDYQTPLDEEITLEYPKPPYSYSVLVTLALKNSRTGRLTVRDIYNFMCNHFPYFRTAPSGWKNSVRHNLSLNPAFLKIVGEQGPARARTACRWTMNPDRYRKMNDEISKFHAKALSQINNSMRNSDLLKMLEEGTFNDFGRAIKGVTVQEKKCGQRRRKVIPKNRKSDTIVQAAELVNGMPGFLNMPIKDESSVEDSTSSYHSFASYAKHRSPLSLHPGSPAYEMRAGQFSALPAPLQYSMYSSENCDPDSHHMY